MSNVSMRNVQTNGYAEQVGADWSAYMFRLSFDLSDGTFRSAHSVRVVATTPAGDAKPAMRAHLDMNVRAYQAARQRIAAMLETEGPRVVADLKEIDLREIDLRLED